MEIEILRETPFPELEEMIRAIPLMGKAADGEDILVYEHANISLKKLKPGEVNPPTFYLLKKQMQIQRALRENLLKQGHDPLNLSSALEIKNDSGEIWTLTPPIIEVTPRVVRYTPKEGEIDHSARETKVQIPLICDGAHRVFLARDFGLGFRGVYISGVNPGFPYYAHPNDWADVQILEEVPKTKVEKKLYSREDCYVLYRDFGKIGCGAPRHVSE